jgi:signal transduction histidine kinase
MHSQFYSSLSSLNLLSTAPACPDLECLTTLSYRSNDLNSYLMEVVRSVCRLIQSDWTIVTLCSGETGQIIASSLDVGETIGFSVHGTLANVVIQSGRSLIIEDNRQNPQQHQLVDYLAYLGVPLRITTGEVIGTICSFLREPRAFKASEVKVVELFAERAATVIENYRLYQQQLRFNERLSQDVATCSTDLKLSQEKLIERERLAAIGEFTAMIVHEVRNPLTTIELGLRYAQKVLPASADRERLDLALSESHRLNRLLNEILCYAKPRVLRLTKLNISEFLDDVLMQIQDLPEASAHHIDYTKDFSAIEVMADTDMLKQVFFNLFRNAFEALQSNTAAAIDTHPETVRCTVSNGNKPNRICIRIHNGGTPIPPELLPQLATPFCSTKPSGTGLGLAISKRIVESHGGELEIASSSSGTTVSVHLPIVYSDR